MENRMTVHEAMELSGDSRLYIQNKIEKGEYVGKFVKGRKRNTYSISRYWYYTNVLGWEEWRVKEYHNTIKGKTWLAYDPEANKRKKEPITLGSTIVN